MNNGAAKRLCLDLLHADTAEAVIQILGDAGFWNNSDCWRHFGDDAGNYSVIGVQQSKPDAALVEKVVNSVDARLMGECQIRGIPLESPEAPRSIRSAVARFFEDREVDGEIGGKIRAWDDRKRRDIARDITIAATGQRANPCLTIADVGEGQFPDWMPLTLLSLHRDNKRRIPFVQGRFNMGGTGVLRFCGEHNLQLLITRRNPWIVRAMAEHDPFAEFWGFTIVRRQDPQGAERNSVYTYLAPIDMDSKPGRGRVLRFKAPNLPLMPERNRPYKRKIEWGTAIKLYEYQATGFRSHILRRDGLLNRLDLLLPGIALPVRLHECRDYTGAEERSYETNMNSLVVRLEDGRHENLEPGFPDTVQFEIERGQRFKARIYAIKKGRAQTYRKNEGIIFAVNGQTYGYLPLSFFGRQRVKMGRLADSLLVLVDCSEMSRRGVEELFLNSHDRLTNGDLRASLEKELEEIIRTNEGLRALRERRQREEKEAQLADSKPLEDVLASIIKSSPSLLALFAPGRRLTNPTKPKTVDQHDKPFRGKPHPTYFRFRKLDYGRALKRPCPVNHRCRILFTTDVVNEYFDRPENPGQFNISVGDRVERDLPVVYSLNLHDGTASLNIKLPKQVKVGETLKVTATVHDDTLVEPFVNMAEIIVAPQVPSRRSHSGGARKKKQPSKNEGDGGESQLGIELPPIDRVKKERWPTFEFDRFSACAVRQGESEANPDQVVYDFHINVDNVFLRTEIKGSSEDARLLEAQFVYGVVLTGLAMIREGIEREKRSIARGVDQDSESHEEKRLEEQVAQVTRALAPFVLPMIRSLGSLEEQDVGALSQVGDEE